MLEYLKTIELVFSKKHLLSKIYLLSLGLILINLSSGSKIIQALVEMNKKDCSRSMSKLTLNIDGWLLSLLGKTLNLLISF